MKWVGYYYCDDNDAICGKVTLGAVKEQVLYKAWLLGDCLGHFATRDGASKCVEQAHIVAEARCKQQKEDYERRTENYHRRDELLQLRKDVREELYREMRVKHPILCWLRIL